MKLRVALAALLGALVAAGVTLGVTAVASAPSTPLAPTDTIAVCANPSTGALKPRTFTLNKVPSSCPVGTTLRTWQPQSLAGTDAGATFISPSTTGCPTNEWKPVLQSLGGTVKWSATGENGDANGCVGLTNGVWKIVVSLSSLPSSFSWIGAGGAAGNNSFSTFVNLDGGTAISQCTSLGAAKTDGSAYQTFCQIGGNQAIPNPTTMLNTAAADGTVVFGPFEVLSTP